MKFPIDIGINREKIIIITPNFNSMKDNKRARRARENVNSCISFKYLLPKYHRNTEKNPASINNMTYLFLLLFISTAVLFSKKIYQCILYIL